MVEEMKQKLQDNHLNTDNYRKYLEEWDLKIEMKTGYDEKLARNILKVLSRVHPEGFDLPEEIKTHDGYISTLYVLLQDELVEGPKIQKAQSGKLLMISSKPVAITWRGREKLKPDWNKRLTLIFLGLTASATVVTAFTQCSSTLTRQETSEQTSYKTEQTSLGTCAKDGT
ncbi:MAG: hypothetical protein OXS28_07480 [Gammaproteobacteria bacterium]|nr:hypothetical protein [Gammaproteobacteria bacterium]